ncbi:MAG: hypothetical protein J2P50_00370 [Hyphomicrobiaceae bacterium]|nr:hypothetical protein [Hyphomicrobiaceae bacterium]
MRVAVFFLVILAWVLVPGPNQASAQTYPERPVTFIVPYGAGGPLDTVARNITNRMRVPLKQNTVIENVPGASGTVGVGRAVRAPPDGYTVCVGNWPTYVVNGAMFNLSYDLVEDFEPVALLTSNPYIMLVRKGLPAKNVRELIAQLKANPGGVTLGTAGPGSGQHIGGLYFQNVTGTTLRFVPYRAWASDIIKDIAGEHIDITFEQEISALPSLRSSIVKAYAVTSDARLAAAPDNSLRRGGGGARCPHLGVDRSVRAQGHAEGGDRNAHQGRHARPHRPHAHQAAGRSGPDHPAARAANSGGLARLPQGRDRALVAAHQGRQYQARGTEVAAPI